MIGRFLLMLLLMVLTVMMVLRRVTGEEEGRDLEQRSFVTVVASCDCIQNGRVR